MGRCEKNMKIYAMSDIHGMLRPFRDRLEQLNMDEIRCGEAKLILLGDYIDRGYNGMKVLKTIYDLQADLGENLIVLKGNHDQWFLDFVHCKDAQWLGNSQATAFLSQFLTDDEMKQVFRYISRYMYKNASDTVRKAMEARYSGLLRWLEALPLYFETEHQIYVHAGIDEDAGVLWSVGTSDEMFLEKYPPTKGEFIKDIVAGHVSTSTVSGHRNDHDIYYDGYSHFYIDGVDSYPMSAKESECVIPLLLYVEEASKGEYYSIKPDERRNLICQRRW